MVSQLLLSNWVQLCGVRRGGAGGPERPFQAHRCEVPRSLPESIAEQPGRDGRGGRRVCAGSGSRARSARLPDPGIRSVKPLTAPIDVTNTETGCIATGAANAAFTA